MNNIIRFFGMVKNARKLLPDWQKWIFLWLEYKTGLRNFRGREDLIVLRDGSRFVLRIGEGEFVNFLEIWGDRVYTKFYSLAPDSVVVDIGANIGLFSLFVAITSKNAKIFSFEPMTDTFVRLANNIHLNGMEKIVTAFQGGVTGEGGERTLFLHPSGSGANTLAPYREDLPLSEERSIQVKTVTLHDIFLMYNLERIHFLKLDCEGAEYEILYHTRDEYFSKIDYIALEYHKGSDELSKFLEQKGFHWKKEVISRTANSGILWAWRENA